ncbi:MAG TPA: hypothetical protein VFH38_12230 [Jatrophihabitans sp.]|nr:hypothetical protein [Jatrophihabitans sp.]
MTQTLAPRRDKPADRIRTAWYAAHAPVSGVPPWARTVAYAIPLTVLPSSLWRIAACTLHLPIVRGETDPVTGPSGVPGLPIEAYVVVLSIFSELVAFAAVGLVARWGEVFPGWLPVLRGRQVPAAAAAGAAASGAAVLTVLWTWVAITFSLGRRIDGSRLAGIAPLGFDGWKGLLAVAAYAPLLLWGPLLAALAVSYWKRRRAEVPDEAE